MPPERSKKLSSLSRRALTKIDNRATLLRMSGDGEKGETRFQGVGVSPGIARGVVQVMRDELEEIIRDKIDPSQIGAEIARFEAALSIVIKIGPSLR